MELSVMGGIALGGASFLVGLSKCGLPGAGILAVPLIAAAVPARASTGLLLPLLIFGDILALIRFRRHAEVRRLVWLLPAAVVGVGIGYVLMGRMTDSQLRPAIGGVILALIGLNVLRDRTRVGAVFEGRGYATALPVGILAGTVTMMANAAGPVMNLYLLAMRLPKAVFIGTGAWYFFLINCFKAPFSANLGLITRESLRINLWALPAVWIGSIIGYRLLSRINQSLFEKIVLGLTVAAAIRLLLPI